MISRSISTSRKLGKCDDRTALIFTWLQAHTDSIGLMDGDAALVKATVVPLRPYTVEDVEESLVKLEEVSLIKRYEVSGEQYLRVIGFNDHQTFKANRPRIGEFPNEKGFIPRIEPYSSDEIPNEGAPTADERPTDDGQESESVSVSKVKSSKVKSNKKIQKPKKVFESKTDGKMLNDLIALFEPINPSFEKLFAQTTQRRALDEMVVKHGFEVMKNTINSLQITNGKKYAPTITTPLQLQNNLGKLIAFWQKEKDAGRGKGKKIAGL